jgi:hypothetical protein
MIEQENNAGINLMYTNMINMFNANTEEYRRCHTDPDIWLSTATFMHTLNMPSSMGMLMNDNMYRITTEQLRQQLNLS